MKKTIFWPVTFILTFSVGLAASAFFYFRNVAIVAITQPLVVEKQVEQPDCEKSISFPGLSRRISELEKPKKGYFPKKILSDDWVSDNSLNDWYGKFLRVMNEPSFLGV